MKNLFLSSLIILLFADCKQQEAVKPCYLGDYTTYGLDANAIFTLAENGKGYLFQPLRPDYMDKITSTVTFDYSVKGDSLHYKMTGFVQKDGDKIIVQEGPGGSGGWAFGQLLTENTCKFVCDAAGLTTTFYYAPGGAANNPNGIMTKFYKRK